MKPTKLNLAAQAIVVLFWTLSAWAVNQNLVVPEGLLPPLNETPVTNQPPAQESQAPTKEPLDLTGIDLKDPSALLDVEQQEDTLPSGRNPAPPTFTSKTAPLVPNPATAETKVPPTVSKALDPDADLENPDPTVSAAELPKVLSPLSAPAQSQPTPQLPNVQPITATAGATLIPPVKKTGKVGPLVMAPEFFHPERKVDSACNPPPGTFTEKMMPPPTVPAPPLKGISDVSIILSNNEFFPSKVLLKGGSQVRLIFTTVNKKPAALVIEKLQIQRWVAKEDEPGAKTELERSKFELTRELSSSRVTEVLIDAKEGTYNFHDVITGATGEISVE